MLSTHTLLAVSQGNFVSLLDPPEEYRAAAAACHNIATWPVLAGREGERSLMLSSPIILYDYPQIAPESAGDFFDGTEIDEMLTLRVLTLSDEEKAGSSRGRRPRAAQFWSAPKRCRRRQFAKMHGAIRGLRKASKLEFREGDRVRLHPRKKADIFDIALDGKIAIVESVERDFEDKVHLAVTVGRRPGPRFRHRAPDRSSVFLSASKKWNWREWRLVSILVACIGNIFQGDDAFGCEVAKVLAQTEFAPDVRVVDFGIRGLDLIYALMDAPESDDPGRCGLARRRAGHALYDRTGFREPR